MTKLVWDRDTGFGIPKAKHKLRVVPFGGFPPSREITMACANCVVVVSVPRETMEAILIRRDQRLEEIPFNAFGDCAGA